MYGETHKYFLQFMIRNGHVSIEDALKFYTTHLKGVNDLNSLKTVILEINQNINKQGLIISTAICEVSNTRNFTLINNKMDSICKLQRSYAPLETEYFQQLLKEIITSDDHKIRIIACYNLSDKLTSNLRKDKIEILLNKLLEQGYLVEKDSHFYLGPRCIMEFEPYFQAYCKDYYETCHLCSMPAFLPKICKHCNKAVHSHCITTRLQRKRRCPNCDRIWEDDQTATSFTSDDSEMKLPNCTPNSKKVRRT